MIRRERVDLVHAHFFASSEVASLLGICCGIRAVATLHGLADIAGGRRSRIDRSPSPKLRWAASRLTGMLKAARKQAAAATRLIARQGYEALSMRRLAQERGGQP